MERLFNKLSVLSGLLGGMVSYVLGGWDVLLKSLVALVILDYVTGVLKAIYCKELSSEVGFRGLIKKVVIFIVVATSNIISAILSDSIPLRDIVIIFFISNEGISLVENAAEFIPIPEKLKNILIQIREESTNEDINNNERKD